MEKIKQINWILTEHGMGRMKFLLYLLPKNILTMNERKFVSNDQYTTGKNKNISGKSNHEVVT